MRCLPITVCSISRPISGSSTSRRPGCTRWRRWCGHERRRHSPATYRPRLPHPGAGRRPVVRADTGASGRRPVGGCGRDPGGHGAERLGQVHPAALLRRDRFGFVSQFGQLVPELTAAENIALPLLLAGTRRAGALARAQDWFARLGLDGLEGRRSGELSGGEAQRVALARALVAEPEVVFADEPTGSLDSLTGEQVMNLLVDAARAQGTTVILVTHEPRVAAYADREVVVRDGRVTSLVAEQA